GQVAGVEGLLVGLRPAEGLDHHVGAVPAGQLLDPGDRVGVPRVDHVGGAEALGPLQLPVVHVHRDDGVRAGQVGAGDRTVAHAAAADHRDALAAGHAAGVDGGADAGHHAAAE